MALISPSSSSDTPAGWPAYEASAAQLLKSASPNASLALLQVHFRQRLALAAAHGQPLTEVAFDEAEARIVAALRPGDHLLRSGHGDFYVLLPRLLGLGHAELAAQRILRELESPIVAGGRHLHLMPTVGAALATEPAPPAEEKLIWVTDFNTALR
jgi:GGDEF domain-containing protein